jgi:hypothetical protein
MSLLDRIGEKLQSGLSSAAAGVGRTARSAQLKIELAGVKGDLDRAYARLGREAYFETVQSRISLPYAAETLREIEYLLNRAATLEQQLADLDQEPAGDSESTSSELNQAPCPEIAAEQPIPPSRLSSPTLPDLEADPTGTPAQDAPVALAGALCRSCNSPLLDGARFCSQCGSTV